MEQNQIETGSQYSIRIAVAVVVYVYCGTIAAANGNILCDGVRCIFVLFLWLRLSAFNYALRTCRSGF